MSEQEYNMILTNGEACFKSDFTIKERQEHFLVVHNNSFKKSLNLNVNFVTAFNNFCF